MAKEILENRIIPIPGTKYGITWGGVERWTLYELASGKRKDTGEAYTEWRAKCWPVDFAHMAKIITDDCGKGAEDLKSMLAEIVAERTRLKSVMETICTHIGEPIEHAERVSLEEIGEVRKARAATRTKKA